MLRLLPLVFMLSGCVAATSPDYSGVPPSIQAGIWPSLYSMFPRHQNTVPARTAQPAAPSIPRPDSKIDKTNPSKPVIISPETLDAAQQKLDDVQRQLDKQAP